MCFNPRTHEGCDFSSNSALNVSCVSIHAPTRGATRRRQGNARRQRFQSTHPRGVRPHSLHRQTAYRRFQSTHPRGVRLRPRCRSTATQSFNPRTHEGCDGKFDGVPATWDVSIHAPTRGATVRSTGSSCKISVSIHAPTRGATRILTLFV